MRHGEQDSLTGDKIGVKAARRVAHETTHGGDDEGMALQPQMGRAKTTDGTAISGR